MPLHQKKTVRGSPLDDIYASADLSVRMPKYRIPAGEHDPRHAYSVVHDELMLDGNSRQNLATFCQTWAEPEVHRLMDECMDRNLTDKDEYPQTDKPNLVTGPAQICWHKFARYWDVELREIPMEGDRLIMTRKEAL